MLIENAVTFQTKKYVFVFSITIDIQNGIYLKDAECLITVESVLKTGIVYRFENLTYSGESRI
jgi:hypothetical protein